MRFKRFSQSKTPSMYYGRQFDHHLIYRVQHNKYSNTPNMDKQAKELKRKMLNRFKQKSSLLNLIK